MTQTKNLSGVFAVSTVLVFLFFGVAGDYLGWMGSNGVCYRYLGCNAGFFGYDAVVHLFSGVAGISLMVWFMQRYPRYDLLPKGFVKKFIALLALAALVGILWEFIEFAYDHFRILVLHMNLFSPDRLAQPSNSDTMGDLFSSMASAALTIVGLRLFRRI